jgi:hypothetical protein
MGKDTMMLSGNLSNWPVSDLLQIMRVTQKTGALRIEAPRAGVVHFIAGQIAGATLAGQRMPATAEDARRVAIDSLHVLAGNVEGSFLVADPEVSDTAPRWEVTEIMAEVDRLRLIEADIKREGIEEGTPLRLASGAPSPVTLHSEDWEALASLVPAFSLATLERSLGRSRALQVVATLSSRGLTVREVEQPTIEIDATKAPVVEEPPVLDWLSEKPADEGVDLSTEIPVASAVRLDGGAEDEEEVEDHHERRSLKAVVASPTTTLVSGVLDDMRRLRTSNS